MERKTFIVIHKTEWERMKRKENTANVYKEREIYIQSLIEKSQEMVNNWSDSVQGHINKVEKQKQLKRAKDKKTIKEFNERKKLKNNFEIIKKTKELIFQDSCYGRQLMSALLESKAIEERDAQVKFQFEIRKKSDIEKEMEPKATSLRIGYENDFDEKQKKLNKRRTDMEIAKINRTTYEKKQKDNKEIKDKEKQQAREDEGLMNNILKNEAKLEKEILYREKKEIKEYELENNKIKKTRADTERQEELIRDVWRKYQDKIQCRERTVFDKIHKESCNASKLTNAYKIIEQLNYEKNKKYEDFIESGITECEKRLNEQDELERKRKINEGNKRKTLDRENRTLLEFKNQIDLCNEKDLCAESLVNEQFREKKKSMLKAEKAAYSNFLAPNNKLLEKLNKCKSEKQSWSGLDAAHAQFARQASDILRQCRYKNMAQKVINDYRRTNYINEKSLPIQE